MIPITDTNNATTTTNTKNNLSIILLNMRFIPGPVHKFAQKIKKPYSQIQVEIRTTAYQLIHQRNSESAPSYI